MCAIHQPERSTKGDLGSHERYAVAALFTLATHFTQVGDPVTRLYQLVVTFVSFVYSIDLDLHRSYLPRA